MAANLSRAERGKRERFRKFCNCCTGIRWPWLVVVLRLCDTVLSSLWCDMSNATLDRGALTDLEATQLCAEAMGIAAHENDDGAIRFLESGIHYRKYQPLTDGAQAMALVKRFKIDIEPMFDGEEGEWQASQWAKDRNGRINKHCHTDLNRAIVYCAAAVQQATTAKGDA